MLSLPVVQGRFAVGATTFVTPVRPSRVFGSAKRRRNSLSSSHGLEDALRMDEVAFTAYYPADISSSSEKGVNWLLGPTSSSLHGFSIFLGIPSWILWPLVYLFGRFIKIPVYPNAPLLRPSNNHVIDDKANMTKGTKRWPLVLFSHGLGGSRTAYSHFCSRLAASGKVVLAIEHRDGTGHACVTRSWEENGEKKSRPIYYIKEKEVLWDDHSEDKESAPYRLRMDQLTFRRKEIFYMYRTFCDFVKGDSSVEIETIDRNTFDKNSWISSDDGAKGCPINYDEDITLAGHSFGGCTSLSILSTSPPDEHEHIPITKTLILDPWLDPLPTPGPIPLTKANPATNLDEVNSSVESSIGATVVEEEPGWVLFKRNPNLPRMLVLNSETFTLWTEHFARLQEVVKAWEPEGEKIVTLVGSVHTSFSDFPILPLARRKRARILMDIIVQLALSFLDSDLEQATDVPKREMEVRIVGVKPNGKPKRKLVGNLGDIIVL
ncbi:hypothetical protein AMATHDRAFT_175231 [Amanita thiersii Skay4041]|uniref:1-alkyl-2-acetylglycerophosphocholine esterase n=1 Tax=Amanita thiersii Skay4041 TaxID=703135 RepID=A0A2A9NUB2_9AGAR|nr:hypothetical protein AMATHDRAFT_175231 [Amanita thiersii Skay4041]